MTRRDFYHIPGETGSWLWLLLSFLLSILGGKLPCSIGWLTGEVFGKLPEGIATGAVQEAKEDQNLGQYQ